MRPVRAMSPIEAVSHLGRVVAQDLPLDHSLSEAARAAADGAQAAACLVLEILPDRQTFVVRAARGFSVPPAPRDFDVVQGTHAHEALAATRPTVRSALPTGPCEPALLAGNGLVRAAAARIGSEERPFGVVAVYARAAEPFARGTPRMLEAVAGLIAVAAGRARLAAELDRERDERFGLASLVAGSDDAIVSATLDGTVLSWNPGAERLYGYPAAEIIGHDVSMLIPAEREADRRLLLERVRAGARIPAFDAVHRRRDGTPITVSLSLSPVRDRHGAVVAVAGIAHDVTETRRLESELRQLAKMEAVGRLAGGLAHDFNNMLTVIDGYSELLLMKLPAGDALRGLVEEIHRAGERAAELTRQLMVFSRKSMVEPQVLNLSEVVAGNVEMLTRALGDDIVIATDLDPAIGHVMADRAQLEQVLVNLVINARDAMPTGGRVTIATRSVERPASGGGDGGRFVALSVTDTGVGMDAATRSRIFEPFFTTKGSGRGTGLGLATLQRFVIQSGGDVTVDSEPGRGTRFEILLPTVPLPATPAARPAPGESPSGTETVLVVEDDEAVRQLTEAVLHAAGYLVLAAGNGAEALALADSHRGPIDLLITDVVMPVLGGHALAEQFRQRHPEATVLFTSGYTPEAVGRRGMAIPPNQFLQKPYSPAALCRQVRRALDRA